MKPNVHLNRSLNCKKKKHENTETRAKIGRKKKRNDCITNHGKQEMEKN